MNKVEELALKEYPVVMTTLIPADDEHPLIEQDCNKFTRKAYRRGYSQAEKDLTDKAKVSSGWDGFYYGQGYKQAKKDLLENKHETSWRLDEKLWSGIKDVEEASYQYMYDASNDWAYEIPTWKDVQDAFKAGSKWKEGFELTWKDIEKIDDITLRLDASEESIGMSNQEFYQKVLKRFKDYKEKKEK